MLIARQHSKGPFALAFGCQVGGAQPKADMPFILVIIPAHTPGTWVGFYKKITHNESSVTYTLLVILSIHNV